MNRRSFLAAVAALPLVGLVPTALGYEWIECYPPSDHWHTDSLHTHSICDGVGHSHSFHVPGDYTVYYHYHTIA